MSESFQIGAKSNQVKPSLDTTKHMFGIVDELAQNFGNELKAAQNRVEATAKTSPRRTEKVGRSESRETPTPSQSQDTQKVAESKHLTESQKQTAESSTEESTEETVVETGEGSAAPSTEEGKTDQVVVADPENAEMVVETPDEFIHHLEADDSGLVRTDETVGIRDSEETNASPEEAPKMNREMEMAGADNSDLLEMPAVDPSLKAVVSEDQDLQNELVEDNSDPRQVISDDQNKKANNSDELDDRHNQTEKVVERPKEKTVDIGNQPKLAEDEGKTKTDNHLSDSREKEEVVVKESTQTVKAEKTTVEDGGQWLSTDETTPREEVAAVENQSQLGGDDRNADETDNMANKIDDAPRQAVRAEAPKKEDIVEDDATPEVEQEDDSELAKTKQSSKKAKAAKAPRKGILGRLSDMITGKKPEAFPLEKAQADNELATDLTGADEGLTLSQGPAAPAVSNEALLPRGQSDNFDPTAFHSIRPSQNGLTLNLNREESAQILRTLADLAKNSRIADPVPEKISDRMLQSLQLSQPSVAQEVQEARNTYGPNGKWLDAQANQESEEAQQNNAANKGKFEELREKIVRQIKFNLRMAVKGKISELNLKLDPPFLGRVKVKIVMETSTAKANFIVENQSVKEVLQKSLPVLTSSLADQGIDVTSVEVNVAQDNHTGDQNGRAFASAEDQQAAREWLASFRTLHEAVGVRDVESEAPAEVDSEGADHIINIMA